MGEIVNLNRARKSRSKADRKAEAVAKAKAIAPALAQQAAPADQDAPQSAPAPAAPQHQPQRAEPGFGGSNGRGEACDTRTDHHEISTQRSVGNHG